ncbi:MAG: hypothetical protein JNM07_08605 [Phycisphaerae bacterium]|nr:hypothetical protein [Phycisphaerae bacterium]
MSDPPTFTLDATYAAAWRALRARYGVLVGAAALDLIAWAAVLGVLYALPRIDPTLLSLTLFVIPTFFFAPLEAGVSYVALRSVRDEDPSLNDILWGFDRYGPVVGCRLLMQAVGAVLTLPAQAALTGGGGAPGALLLAGLLYVLTAPISLYITTRFWLAPLICLDPSRGIRIGDRTQRPGMADAMRISWRLTGPHAWLLLLVVFLSWAMPLAGIALLLAGAPLLGVPLSFCVQAAAYQLITGRATPRTGSPSRA